MSDLKLTAIVFFVWTALVAGTTWYIMDSINDRNIIEKQKEIEMASKKIDSIKTIRNQKLDSVISESNLSVKKSKEILKKINHEKIIIPDASYDSMCQYIENYRPK